MTHDEHIDCDNQLCEAEDKIIALRAENKRLKAMYESAKGDLEDVMNGHEKTDNLVIELQAENERLKKMINDTIAGMEFDAVQGRGEWQVGMFCGLEDRNIIDRYDACEYGYEKALEKVQEWIIDPLEQAQKENENEWNK